MKQRSIEKLLFSIAALLVTCGTLIKFMNWSENFLGLYLVLAGHIAGIIAIFMYMKHANDMERQNQHIQQKVRRMQND
ncbi:hypothetical protein [Pontibacter harenae]|uniref:hypothetical protein n=1 Tax=Pontibacter harenae TaxID=2894083 RepID=UPI001E3CBCDA|nr:hypothetical protein [Pontibacter harenae]MCC9168957.1 hypothetical protein [Pontibacter harenae]